MIESPERLARAFGGSELVKVKKLPNGRAFYFDIPTKRHGRRVGWQTRTWRRLLGGNLANPQFGGVGDSGVPTRTQVIVFQVSLTPASVATIVAVEQSLTVTGILASDILVAASPTVAMATAVGAAAGHVSAANTIALAYVNPTAGALVPTPGTYNVVVLRG
jgi:hypothetical protein